MKRFIYKISNPSSLILTYLFALIKKFINSNSSNIVIKKVLSLFIVLSLLIPLSFAYAYDYRYFYGVVWRGLASDNIKFAKQMGYHYVANQAGMRLLPEAKDTKFYVINPELDVSPVSIELDLTKTYSPDEKHLYKNYFVWKSDTATFPNNIASGWWYNDNKFLVVYDFQQQAVIDATVEAIINKVKSFENLSIGYTFGGLMWDVPDLKGDFWIGGSSDRKFVDISYWTGKDSCASSKHTHEYLTYSDGKAAFFKKLYKRVREDFPDAKFIGEPFLIYDRWISQIENRPDAQKLMPDMLTQEAPGTQFVDDTRIFNSGLVTKDRVGLSAPNIFGEYDNRLHAAKAAINGAWFTWFGRFGGSGDMPDYSNIYEVPPRIQLIRALPNWDNLKNTPLSLRSWDGIVYKSPNSFADANIIYSRHPDTGKIFAVFHNTTGRIKLGDNEEVLSVSRTNGLFIETEDGKDDLKIINNEISLINNKDAGKGYIITTTYQNNTSIPSPPDNLRMTIME